VVIAQNTDFSISDSVSGHMTPVTVRNDSEVSFPVTNKTYIRYCTHLKFGKGYSLWVTPSLHSTTTFS